MLRSLKEVMLAATLPLQLQSYRRLWPLGGGDDDGGVLRVWEAALQSGWPRRATG